MILFKLTKKCFESNTFITRKNVSLNKTLNNFGFIHHIKNNGIAVVWWYDNFRKAELSFKLSELHSNYKSIYPYYNNNKVRGNIWKYSYLTLLSKVHSDRGLSQIKVDKMVYKKTANVLDNVLITDAVYVLQNKITSLEGTIVSRNRNLYEVETKQGVFVMKRSNFRLLPQDDFYLLNIRCY